MAVLGKSDRAFLLCVRIFNLSSEKYRTLQTSPVEVVLDNAMRISLPCVKCRSLSLFTTTVMSLTGTLDRQLYRWKEDKKRPPAPSWSFGKYPPGATVGRVMVISEARSWKSSSCHTDTALRGSQAQQWIISVSNITGEEKIIPKFFLANSEIKPGPAHEAQQMSQEPAVNLKYMVMVKPSTAESHLKPSHSWVTPDSADKAVALAPPGRQDRKSVV